MFQPGAFWTGRKHQLDKMNLRDLVNSYLAFPAIQAHPGLEFCHFVQHLAYEPKSTFLKEIKRLHLAHHFHNETGNFRITSFFWGRILGTFYGHPHKVPKSVAVFDLGYAGETAERWRYVARLTEAWGQARLTRRAEGAAA